MNENPAAYSYELPEENIAKYPLADRSSSKLLHYQNGLIRHRGFKDIPDLLPAQSLLVMNNTRVIPARIHIQKPTGAHIEVFLLSPIAPTTEVASAMVAKGHVTWKCMIGNAKRWKVGAAIEKHLNINDQGVDVVLTRKEQNMISFDFPEDITFSSLIEAFGSIPLPPYLKRDVNEEDKESYQTVYSAAKGAVAAPTAGLHFTDEILDQIKARGIEQAFTTLHVSAGTFQPIAVDDFKEHPMHTEQMVITHAFIRQLIRHEGKIIPVGTTSMRTLESLYWYGVKIHMGESAVFDIDQNDPYLEREALPDRTTAFKAIDRHMEATGINECIGQTSIFIYPGYTFRVCAGLITNFHLPKSTLILLVAALIGDDWRKVYQEAVDHDYRFLSYGDSSLLIP